MENMIENEHIESILTQFGFAPVFTDLKSYANTVEDDGWMKIIFRVTLENGKMLVIKLLHEDKDLEAEHQKYEKQSAFSEAMRAHGIRTPVRHQTEGVYCIRYVYRDLPCIVAVEDWCGDEITEITVDIAYRIGELMARMHTISLENSCEIGHRTLFSAAYWNDVDAYPDFCEITADEKLDQSVAAQIKALHEEKLERIRAVWENLPKAAVQGDVSINNLVDSEDGLIVFDYNNAGDEVLISDLVMEGLLTAYGMDLPEGVPASYREKLFPAFLNGYLSVRPLSEAESEAAWEVYTLYHALWFTKIVYFDGSLQKHVESGNYDAANELLRQILVDMTEEDDGRFSE